MVPHREHFHHLILVVVAGKPIGTVRRILDMPHSPTDVHADMFVYGLAEVPKEETTILRASHL